MKVMASNRIYDLRRAAAAAGGRTKILDVTMQVVKSTPLSPPRDKPRIGHLRRDKMAGLPHLAPMVTPFLPADPKDLQHQADLYRRLANVLAGDTARDLRRLATDLERKAVDIAA